MLALVMLSLVLGAEGPCFAANDATPGWKQVTLAEGQEGLAAPPAVDQFRADEPVTIIDSHSGLYLAGHGDGLGVAAFDFSFEPGARSLELHFTDSLRGAKVDVTASGRFGEMSLMHEQRVGASSLSLAWGMNEVTWLRVRVHDHLRKDPVLDGWTSVRRVGLEQLGLSGAFRLHRSLYYLQPVGPAVRLCVAPGQELALHTAGPKSSELPVPVLLRRVQ